MISWRDVARQAALFLLRCLARAHSALNIIRHQVLPLCALPLGYLRSHRQRVFVWPTEPPPLGPRVAVVCHFDARGKVRPDVLRYLAALRDAGFDVAVVSNSGALRTDARTRLQEICVRVIVRRNIGYDFCAWREALEVLALPQANTQLVLLANDSVYGPLRPLTPTLARIASDEAVVWGLTDSYQIRLHLQSYFLAVHAAALRSAAWQRFWRNVRPVPSKRAMILRYETRLTQVLAAAGMACRAVWPVLSLPLPKRVPPLRHVQLNPTHDLWRELLDGGFPFIKRELLRDNPAHVPGVADWRQAIGATNPQDIAAIEQDLAAGASR